MDYPKLIVSNQKEEYNSIQRANVHMLTRTMLNRNRPCFENGGDLNFEKLAKQTQKVSAYDQEIP